MGKKRTYFKGLSAKEVYRQESIAMIKLKKRMAELAKEQGEKNENTADENYIRGKNYIKFLVGWNFIEIFPYC